MCEQALKLNPDDYRTRILDDLGTPGADAWNALVRASCDGDLPAFLRYEWLDALARTGCTGPGTGWVASHLLLYRDETLVAAAPCYLKSHSWGEYVFDWAWADAYRQHGLRYYPKLTVAVPFTPVSGPRLLARDDAAREALARALLQRARDTGVSSLHLLFPRDVCADALHDAGLMIRRGVQFHWRNDGFKDFEAFLASLTQPKRKKIRAERRRVAEAGIRIRRLHGPEIDAAHWAFFFRCYEAGYAAHGSTPYLSPEFFDTIGRTMPEHLILLVASRDERPIAAALLVRDRDRLYGRYWGALEQVPCLHFELAYYQAIETAIALGVAVIEGGAQGEHKLARGFLPVQTCSAHWLAEPAFADAVDRFLKREGQLMDGYVDELIERSPFRQRPQDGLA